MDAKDTANIGLSEDMHAKLKQMADDQIFSDMKDGYRLAASIAIRDKLDVKDRVLTGRKNMYDVGGIDEDNIYKNSISVIFPDQFGQEYKYLEKLADAGMELIYSAYESTGSFDVISILNDDA